MAAQAEVDAISALDAQASDKPHEPWGVPAMTIVATACLVAIGRIAEAAGDLKPAAGAGEAAMALQNKLSYTESPYWYYPERHWRGCVRLRPSAIRSLACATTAGPLPGCDRVLQAHGRP